ncbi:unnamed protein product [Caenorhabditis brenneri]
MGATIVKLINEDSSVDRNDDNDFDLEQGESPDSTSWDSDDSTSDDFSVEERTGMTPNPNDPYIVEKRFVAGSNEYFYNIVKRK